MTRNDETHTLAASSIRGRYALDNARGSDITSGQPLSIYLNGQWIDGSVEHDQEIYANQGLQDLFEKPSGANLIGGYYFIASNGGICGLCIGMKVRLR